MNFYFRKDSQKYRIECKQCMSDKRKEGRNNIYKKAKSYSRENFQQNKKGIEKKPDVIYELQINQQLEKPNL